MAYIPLHHKYRPQRFADVVGQSVVVQTLSNAIQSDRIAPAYLFCGPRGTGKTSSARILAKSLNCVDGPTPKPCNQCEACSSITNGSSLDVIEIDAASNTGVDNIRDLIERSQFAPVNCRYKVYVLDEVHMLSTAAFNALLKTLEEPPPPRWCSCWRLPTPKGCFPPSFHAVSDLIFAASPSMPWLSTCSSFQPKKPLPYPIPP